MVKVIDGKRYDTAKAESIYAYFNGHYQTDFRHRTKRLHRTKSGRWFLYHYGGAFSDIGDGTHPGESIEPISDDDAYGFLQAHSEESDALAAIDTYFADRIEEA